MKKITKTRKGEKLEIPQHGYWRRLVRQIVSSLTKRQNENGLGRKLDVIMDMLKDMGDSVELMAREMARQAKRDARDSSH